jgi:hypothetical protein
MIRKQKRGGSEMEIVSWHRFHDCLSVFWSSDVGSVIRWWWFVILLWDQHPPPSLQVSISTLGRRGGQIFAYHDMPVTYLTTWRTPCRVLYVITLRTPRHALVYAYYIPFDMEDTMSRTSHMPLTYFTTWRTPRHVLVTCLLRTLRHHITY